jgi:hypothetical protein
MNRSTPAVDRAVSCALAVGVFCVALLIVAVIVVSVAGS